MREIAVDSSGVSLAGSVWLPAGPAVGSVLMHPGSGASDRDNDGYFRRVRERLLDAGVAVSAFDKRGVGGSAGRWPEAGIVEQADDLLACLTAILSDAAVPKPVGLFGHSQGGWVVVEAAGRNTPAAFVVANSGPGVTPAEQERYAHRTYLTGSGVADAELAEALAPHAELMNLSRRGATFADVRPMLKRDRLPPVYRRRELILFPDDDELWDFLQGIADYDPRPALEAISVPVLAIFGADDPIVPVGDSVAVYREAVRPELLTVAVFQGADHRIQTGDPPRLADGYLETLTNFVLAAVRRR